MTLVLSCATPDHVIQVSDRRVTYDGGRIADDARNKGISFEGRFVVAYSGLAQIGDLLTDVWISMALASAENRHPFDFLAQAAANDIGRLRCHPKHKRIAIIAVGWVQDAIYGFCPAQSVISNALREDWSWHAEAQDEFEWRENLLNEPANTKARWALSRPIGAQPSDDILRNLCRGFLTAKKRNLGPVAVARLLAEAIRAVAKVNPHVGKNLVVLISPRPSGTSEVGLLTSVAENGGPGPPDLTNTACYLLAEGSLDFVWAMPNFVMNGWAMTDCQISHKDGKHAHIACIRREGTGSAGLKLGGANGNEVRLEMTKGKPRQIRIIRPGQPDEVLPEKRRPAATVPDILTNRPQRR